MKKIIKNTVLAMLTICFLLNIVNLIGLAIEHYVDMPQIAGVAQQVSNEVSTSEDIYQALASFYNYGYGNKLEIQMGILGLSVIFGTMVGLMTTFENKSKIKFILNYFLGLLLVSLLPTLFYMYMYEEVNLFSEFLYNIEYIWKWYTLIFIIIYVIRLYISNKDAKKLNETLRKKNEK